MTRSKWMFVAVAVLVAGCKGEKGDPGPAGPLGHQGDLGPVGMAGPTGPLPDVSYVGRLLEAEGAALSSSVNTGTVGDDATASKGKVRFAAASGAGGRPWAIGSADVGGLLGVGRTQVVVRAKVGAVTSSAMLASLQCLAQRAGDTSTTLVSPAFEIRPNEFVAGQWRELAIQCDFLPDDAVQFVVVDNFSAGVTDLSLDYVRITPSAAGHLLAKKTCTRSVCGQPSESVPGGWVVVKGESTSDPMQVVATVGSGPVMATMAAEYMMSPNAVAWCGISVLNSSGARVALAELSGHSVAEANFDCSASWVFDLPPGRYTFQALGYTNLATTVTWLIERQIAVIQL